MIWDLPNTLIGLFVALITGSRYVKTHYPALVFHWGGWLKRYMEKRGYRGITFGHVVLVHDVKEITIVSHELIHVYQNQMLGPFFFPLYGIFSLIAWCWPGKHYYRDNLLERWAYSWQDFCRETGETPEK